MTTQDANPASQQAIVEAIRVARRAEESARMHVSLSLPVKGAEQLLPFLAGSLKNPVLVSFELIQARLPESTTITGPDQKSETIEVLTTVDGQPATVVLPVHKGGRRNEILPHPYKDDVENKGKCLYCKKGEAYQAHEQARIDTAARAKAFEASVDEKIANANGNGHRANPTELAALGAEREAALQHEGETPHAFVAHEGDNQCEACGRAAEADVHAGVEEDALPEHMRATAESLIEQAQETQAVPS